MPRYPVSYWEGGATVSDAQVARVEKQWTERGQSLVDAVRESADAAGVKARAAIAKSDLVAETIINVAKKHKCDLVVMASHGRKGIKRLLLGSETLHVLTHSSVPVLVLR